MFNLTNREGSMTNRNAASGTANTLKTWLIGVAVALTMALLSWIGISNLKSMEFQAAVTPQIQAISDTSKTTAETVGDIRVQMAGYATKKQLASEVQRMEDAIQEMEKDLARLCVVVELDCKD